MRIHFLQHVAFEGPAYLEQWANMNHYQISISRLYENPKLPSADTFDMLVIMGGPMGIYDEREFPWLIDEKKYIASTIKSGKKVLGICLGAQLIADVMGAKVYKNKYKEIGWFNIELTEAGNASKLFPNTHQRIEVFHWHGDTFDLPANSLLLASSEACNHQAFLYNNQVLGLQFHMEITKESIATLINHCKHELIEGQFIQKENQMINLHKINKNNQYMAALMNSFQATPLLFK